jgi:transcription initiation factor TFIIA large subunit
MHVMPQHYPPAHFVPQPPPAPGNHIKKEPLESRYILSGQFVQPPQIQPQIPPLRPPPNTLLTFPAGPSRPPVPPTATPVAAPAPAVSPAGKAPQQPQSQPQPPQSQPPPRIPQVDGPSSSSSDSSSPSPQQYAPHSSHPSLPQPSQSSAGGVDDEAINSDLDDSDSEGEEDPEEGPGVSDIVFCTYDKVWRLRSVVAD